MRDLIDIRLSELRAELEAGHRAQVELDARQEELRRMTLRISGAIQVLGELTTAHEQRESEHRAARGDSANAPAPLRRVVER